MKKNSILAMISLMIMTSCNSQPEKLRIDEDWIAIINLVQINRDYFKDHNNDNYPRTYYTSLIIESKAKLIEKSTMLSLLKKKEIVEIYFFSSDEIWLVYKTKQRFLKIQHYIVGYGKEVSIKKLRIVNSFTTRVRALEPNWYSGIVEYSLID